MATIVAKNTDAVDNGSTAWASPPATPKGKRLVASPLVASPGGTLKQVPIKPGNKTVQRPPVGPLVSAHDIRLHGQVPDENVAQAPSSAPNLDDAVNDASDIEAEYDAAKKEYSAVCNKQLDDGLGSHEKEYNDAKLRL